MISLTMILKSEQKELYLEGLNVRNQNETLTKMQNILRRLMTIQPKWGFLIYTETAEYCNNERPFGFKVRDEWGNSLVYDFHIDFFNHEGREYKERKYGKIVVIIDRCFKHNIHFDYSVIGNELTHYDIVNSVSMETIENDLEHFIMYYEKVQFEIR